ncbi:MAG: citrate/2-methylcitrate synthase, partial [Candidatus Dormibacteraceae bacterium]
MSEFSPGLEGVVAARTAIGHVDGENGRLIYRGYSIGDLASSMTYEEVAHLLWYGELPTTGELAALTAHMAEHRGLSGAAMATLRAMPADADPMDVLRTVLSAQGASATLVRPTLDEAIRLAACLPTILAGFDRLRHGQDIVPPRKDGDHATSYLRMLTGEEPPPEKVASLNAYLVLLADHGMNASTFTARVIASTNSDLCSALVGAVGALKGPAHGGAPALVLKMLEQIGTADNVEPWMRAALGRHERLM